MILTSSVLMAPDQKSKYQFMFKAPVNLPNYYLDTSCHHILCVSYMCSEHSCAKTLRAYLNTLEQLGLVGNTQCVESASLSSGFGHPPTSCEAVSPSISNEVFMP